MAAKIYEDQSGKKFRSQKEAAASNTRLGTNPSTRASSPGVVLGQTDPYQGNTSGPIAKTTYSKGGNSVTLAGTGDPNFDFSTLSSQNLSSTSSINVPAPTYTNYQGAAAGAFSVKDSGMAIPAGWDTQTYNNYKKANPTFEPDAEDTSRMLGASQSQDQSLGIARSFLKELGLDKPPESKQNLYKQMQQESQVLEFKRQMDDYTSQLKMIKAKAEADQLALEGQGRGQTTSFIGGEQARIAREAAIDAIPVAALLESAQGRYESAKAQLDTMFKIISDDLDNQRKYKMDLFSAVMPFATAQEKRRLELLDRDDQRKYEQTQALEKAKHEARKQATLNGAPQSIITAIGMARDIQGVDIAAGAYGTDMLDRQYKQAQIDKLRAEVNEKTRKEESAKQQLQNNETLTLAKQLRDEKAAGKKEAVGASPAKFFDVGGILSNRGLQPDRSAYQAKVDRLKSSLTLDNLSLLKGPMSDKDLLFLTAIGSNLDVNMRESEFNKELDRVIDKLEAAGATSGPQEGDTRVYEGVTYVVRNGNWVPK